MQDGPYREIPVDAKTHTVFALVSPEDYEALAAFSWHLTPNGYAVRYTKRPGEFFLMHRQILGLVTGDGHEGDHIDRDKLNYRRSNLRIVTHADNGRNVGSQAGTSKYRGVIWYRTRSRWRAGARFNYRQHHLGYFFDEDEAARAVNAFWVGKGYEAPNAIS